MKHFYLLLILLFAQPLRAEMVDTFQFHSDQDRVRAVSLAKSLRCPQCQNQNLVESNATVAYNLRLEVYEMVNAGKTDQEIIDIMTDRFGNFVNYDPPFNAQTGLLWAMPVALGSLLLGFILWRTRKNKQK